MNQITAEDIISAAQEMANNPELAKDILFKWSEDDDCVILSCNVLSNDNIDNQTAFYSAVLLDHKIPLYWGKISDDIKEQIKQLLISKIKEAENPVLEKLCNALSHIAVYEWPETWDDFHLLILPHEEENNISSFSLLNAFINDIETSMFITDGRRQKLRNKLMKKVEQIWPKVIECLNYEDYQKQAFLAYEALLRWVTPLNDDMIQSNEIENLIKFLSSESTIEFVLNCFETIFIKRTDSSWFFIHYHEILFKALSKIQFKNGHSITTVPKVISFILKIFYKYSNKIFDYIYNESDQESNQIYRHIIQILLSLQGDKLNRKFWVIFSQIGEQLTSEKIGNHFHAPITPFFLNLIDNIRTTLYQFLPYATNDDGILNEEARSCFAKWIEYDYQGMVEFLSEQVPSPSFCYALGCYALVRAPTSDMGEINQIIQMLFPDSNFRLNSSTDDSDFHIALLYGLSRSSVFLRSMNLFEKYIEYNNQCLSDSDERVNNAASWAFLYTAIEHPVLFLNDENEFADDLFSKSEFFIFQLSRDASIRMFQCIVSLLQFITDHDEYYPKIFEPVVQALKSEDGGLIEKALLIITECVDPKKKESISLIKKINPIVLSNVLEIANIFIKDTNKTPDCIEIILNCLTTCSYGFNYEEDKETIFTIFSLFVSRGEILPCFLTFIGNLRNNIPEIGEIYEQIHSSFVVPALNQNPPLYAETLTLISRFKGVNNFDFNWFFDICIASLTDYDRNANIAAVKVLIRIFREISSKEFYDLLNSYGVKICTAIFNAMMDSMHKSVFEYYSKLSFKICIFLVDGNQNSEEWLSLVLGSLNNCKVQEPSENLFTMFAKSLNQAVINQDRNEFEENFKDFLILTNRISPGDERIFLKSKHKHHRDSTRYSFWEAFL